MGQPRLCPGPCRKERKTWDGGPGSRSTAWDPGVKNRALGPPGATSPDPEDPVTCTVGEEAEEHRGPGRGGDAP